MGRTGWGHSGNIERNTFWDFPVDVLLECIESNTMSTREGVFLILKAYRFAANPMTVTKGAQMTPAFALHDLDWNADPISHSRPLRPFS